MESVSLIESQDKQRKDNKDDILAYKTICLILYFVLLIVKKLSIFVFHDCESLRSMCAVQSPKVSQLT